MTIKTCHGSIPRTVTAETRTEADALFKVWTTALALSDYTGRQRDADAEQAAYEQYLDFIDSHNLTWTRYDPRGGTPDNPRGEGS